MTNEELVKVILDKVGGRDNVLAATNCMTRLRIDVKDDAKIDEEGLKGTEGVMGVVHDKVGYVEVVVGPGKCRKCADICASMDIPAAAGVQASEGMSVQNDWKANKEAVKAGQKQSKVKAMLKTFGEIFIPLLPGVIAAGLCSGLATLLTQVVPGYAESSVWNLIYNLLTMINQAFLTYLTAWAGYRAAEKFGATPILGGMLGMITTLGGIDNIAMILGLYDEANPLNAILRSGRGGVLAAVIGVWCLAKVEKWIRKRMPDALDIMFTPILTLIVVLIPYILVIMPATGYISTGLCWIVEQVCMSDVLVVRIIAGYLSALLFLPMVAMGMHHGLVALYTVQLETLGFVTLYPALGHGWSRTGRRGDRYLSEGKESKEYKNPVCYPRSASGRCAWCRRASDLRRNASHGQALYYGRSWSRLRRRLCNGHAGSFYYMGTLRPSGSVCNDRRTGRSGHVCRLLCNRSCNQLCDGLCDNKSYD